MFSWQSSTSIPGNSQAAHADQVDLSALQVLERHLQFLRRAVRFPSAVRVLRFLPLHLVDTKSDSQTPRARSETIARLKN